MGKKKIKVIVKNPGKPATLARIPNDLDTLQELVGGFIETVRIAPDVVLIINEEGRVMDPPLPEQKVYGMWFAGPVVVAGTRGSDFTDVPKAILDAPGVWKMEE